MKKVKPIYVTQPNLPEIEDLMPYIHRIWDNKILTNSGPIHQELEIELAKYLGVKYISLFSNATVALVAAIQALDLAGEIITTPYSFVATSHSILWNKIQPIFVDITKDNFNIDPSKIENAITSSTSAILPVHVYGNPCNQIEIERIANKYSLKVIYDAAHSFGVKPTDHNVFSYGDLSVLSFHATKVFNTFEGGAIVSNTVEMKRKIDNLKNFGFINEETVVEAGLNGKMSEINAAIGLLQLKNIDGNINSRRNKDEYYRRHLNDLCGIRVPEISKNICSNYSYFPIIVDDNFNLTRDELYLKFRDNNIYARKYFYPLISNFSMYKDLPSANTYNLPIANLIAKSILCLPIYPALTEEEQDMIINVIKS